MIELIILIILSLISIISLIVVLNCNNILVCALITALISLNASIMFIMMKAPDVAMTEAAIGAALSGAILIGVIVRVKREDR